MRALLKTILFFLAAVPFNAQAACDGDFARMKPELRLPSSEKEILDRFQANAANWKKIFSPERLKKKLIQIQDDPHAARDSLPGLTDLSIESQKVAAAYASFAASQNPSPEFLRLAHTLIELKEAAGSGKSSTAQIAALAKRAEQFLGALPENYLDAKLITPAQLRARARKQAVSLKNFLNEDELPTPKDLQQVVILVRELGASAGSSYLNEVEASLAPLHNGFLKQQINGEIDFNRQRFFLHPLLRQQLTTLQDALEKASSSAARR